MASTFSDTAETGVARMIEGGRHLVPPHMWDAVERYFVHRTRPGDFLTALLSNDLMGAMGRADDVNAAAIREWCRFLYNYAPAGSYGSPEAVQAWLNTEALADRGLMAEHEKLEMIQADWIAAENMLETLLLATEPEMLSPEECEAEISQAFARHRIAATDPLRDELIEALERIAGWLRNGDYDSRGGLIEMDRLASLAEATVARAKGQP